MIYLLFNYIIIYIIISIITYYNYANIWFQNQYHCY